jgi:hypothetical protein
VTASTKTRKITKKVTCPYLRQRRLQPTTSEVGSKRTVAIAMECVFSIPTLQCRRSNLDFRPRRQELDLLSFESSQQWRDSVSVTRLQASAIEASPAKHSWHFLAVLSRAGLHLATRATLFLHTPQHTLLTRSIIRGTCQSEPEPILRALSRNQFQSAGLCKHVAGCDKSEPCRRLSYVRAAPLDPFVLASACTAINTLPTLRRTVGLLASSEYRSWSLHS